MNKPLIGRSKLIKTMIATRILPGCDGEAMPLTPEQATIALTCYAEQHGDHSAQAPGIAALTVAPLIIDGGVHAAISLVEEPAKHGFTILLPPADFNLVAAQFERTRAIIEDELAAAAPASPPPPAR